MDTSLEEVKIDEIVDAKEIKVSPAPEVETVKPIKYIYRLLIHRTQ